jgi:hypothetical protein
MRYRYFGVPFNVVWLYHCIQTSHLPASAVGTLDTDAVGSAEIAAALVVASNTGAANGFDRFAIREDGLATN